MGRKVLIIEDDDAASEYARMVLDLAGYKVAVAFDGAEGLRKAREFKPHLAIVDLMLPNIHGYTVCERLREDAELKGLKILVCSAKSYAQDVGGAMDAGADDYLTKPYKDEELLGKLDKLLGKNGAN